MIRIRDLSLRPGEGMPQLLRAAAKQLGRPTKDILRLQIVRKSIDARKKQDVRVIYTVDAAVRKIEETEGEGAAERARRAMTEALKAREAEAACSKHGEDK